jgi:hypothetical protein
MNTSEITNNRDWALAEAKHAKAQKPHNRYAIAPATTSVNPQAYFVAGYNVKESRWEELLYVHNPHVERITNLLIIDGKSATADLPWEEVELTPSEDPNRYDPQRDGNYTRWQMRRPNPIRRIGEQSP